PSSSWINTSSSPTKRSKTSERLRQRDCSRLFSVIHKHPSAMGHQIKYGIVFHLPSSWVAGARNLHLGASTTRGASPMPAGARPAAELTFKRLPRMRGVRGNAGNGKRGRSLPGRGRSAEALAPGGAGIRQRNAEGQSGRLATESLSANRRGLAWSDLGDWLWDGPVLNRGGGPGLAGGGCRFESGYDLEGR